MICAAVCLESTANFVTEPHDHILSSTVTEPHDHILSKKFFDLPAFTPSPCDMIPEINAATEFLSRIFLAHDNITKEKVLEFRQHLSSLLEERFRNHWHEHCPTKGQAYRCIRVCPEEPLDPLLERVCQEVGINVGDFHLPFELTLWVDPTEVVCKFGDLRCSYHTVAKKDLTSGNLNNQTDKLDINNLLENARDLYLQKQTIVIHPLLSTEMHISSPYTDGSSSGITMAIRINGTVHYDMSSSPPTSYYDGSPRGKSKFSHRRNGGSWIYYGRSSRAFGTYHSKEANDSFGSIYSYQPSSEPQHFFSSTCDESSDFSGSYSNGYLNGYMVEENGFDYDRQSLSPPSPTLPIDGDESPSPPAEQPQQQIQNAPAQLSLASYSSHQNSGHQVSTNSSTNSHHLPTSKQPLSSLSIITKVSPNNGSKNRNNNSSGSSFSGLTVGKTSISNGSTKYQGTRTNMGPRMKQTGPAKEMKA